MPSTASSTPSSIADGGVKGKDPRRKEAASSPLSEVSAEISRVTIEYDPPPASWYNSDQEAEKARSENITERDNSSSTERKNSPSSGTKDHSNNNNNNNNNSASNHHDSNTDWGMVSDNEEDEDEGFNFVAVSNSLLMIGRSFEHVLENKSPKEDTDVHFGASSDQHRGVLIMDGVGSDDGAIVGSTNHNNNNNNNSNSNNTDASVLTIPGDDSLPSDIGTISHHEEDEDNEDHSDTLFGVDAKFEGGRALVQGSQNQRGAMEEPYFQNYPPLVHRFLKNLQRTRRQRLVSDASDENGGFQSSGISVVRNNDEEISMVWSVDAPEDRFGRSPRKFFSRGYSLLIVSAVVLLTTAFAGRSFVVSQRNQIEAWEERLLKEEEATARLLAEKDSLRQEMEILLVEAVVATARADSLVREQERLLLQREESEKAEKERSRLLQEQEQRKQQEQQNQKRRREQPWRSTSGESEGFEWFLDDSNEECSGHKDDGSSTYTIADNCWFKAKADINLGSCGGETKDYFRGVWNGLWKDWDYYLNESTMSHALEPYPASSSNSESQEEKEKEKEKEQNGNQRNDDDNKIDYNRIGSGGDQQDREGDHDDQGRDYEYQDDTYYPPQDPLQELYSVIHSAGQSFVNNFSKLMSDEVETTQNAAREMEKTVSRRYSDASQTISDTVETAKEDMRDLSKEALLALRAAIKKSSGYQKKNSDNGTPPDDSFQSSTGEEKEENSSPPTRRVTRKELFDAATALGLMSKTWQEYSKSVFVAGEGTEE